MSENDKDKNSEENAELPEENEAPQPNNKRKKIIITAAILIILVIIAVIGFILKHRAGAHDAEKGAKNDHSASNDDHKEANAEPTIPIVTLDEFIVNLNTNGKSASFLKLKIKLELEDMNSQPKVIENIPIIRDSLQLYLRELRPNDLQGSIGLYRLREELLIRLNKILYPIAIKNVLFDQVLIQ